MLCRGNSCVRRGGLISKGGSVAVYVNVYDLTSMNGYAYWLGLGVYHSAVQVYGVEYAYGAHEYSTSGIFESKPRQCEGFVLRKSILVGWTNMTRSEVRKLMVELAQTYKGNAYNLITKNCNHFCNDACIRLTGNHIPNWVNRLAKIGLLCHCLVPMSLSSTKIGRDGIEDKECEEEKKKLRSRSNRLSKSSSMNSLSSSSSMFSSVGNEGKS